MSHKSIQDLLPLVEQPSRYLGSEVNHVKKDHHTVKLTIALAFPELYEIGTSHFGVQILYHILNQHPDIAAERVYCPAMDMNAQLKATQTPLMSLETQTPIQQFDILGFSLLYEMNYTNVLSMLDRGNIPFLSSQRNDSHPIVIAGGPCTCNPEPVADIFDAMVIGDGEAVILEMAEAWMEWNDSHCRERQSLLEKWSRIEGVYIPSFYTPVIDEAGFASVIPIASEKNTIKRAIVSDLDEAPFPDRPIVPYGKPVHDRLRLEISRGCTRGCRFCQAGMLYRPVRERSPKTLLELSEAALSATGYEDLSLLSLSTGDYRCITPLLTQLMARKGAEHTAISLPSLRAGTLTPELMKLIQTVRKTGFTIAPEAGSQRLRDLINKDISEKEIVETVNNAFLLGWKVIKLYFMVGLPTERDEDLQAIVALINTLKRIKGPGGRRGKINVSVATFIPKPHTPFQWVSQIPLQESRNKIRWLQQHLRGPGIQFKWQDPEISRIEGLWARGDRRLNRLLVAAYRKGAVFDGWSDTFDIGTWEAALSESGVDADDYTCRERKTAEPLPWDHIDLGVSKDFLEKEWEKALSGERTPDCRDGHCQDCGVCDFQDIEPKVYPSFQGDVATTQETVSVALPGYRKVRALYSKRDQARYFGHLEMVNIFIRAIRRAGIPVRFSEGFHPKPKISFDDPLPLGMESLKEAFYIQVSDEIEPQDIANRLNAQLPEGLVVHDCQLYSAGKGQKPTGPLAAEYLISLREGAFEASKYKAFAESRSVPVTRRNRKGKEISLDLKDIVLEMTVVSADQLHLSLKSVPGKNLRPLAVIGPVFDLDEECLKLAKVVKTGITALSEAP
ncbi:MAG: TIGR03960 family B12-binding radical SAM protein [Desulfobacterales bacterium]